MSENSEIQKQVVDALMPVLKRQQRVQAWVAFAAAALPDSRYSDSAANTADTMIAKHCRHNDR